MFISSISCKPAATISVLRTQTSQKLLNQRANQIPSHARHLGHVPRFDLSIPPILKQSSQATDGPARASASHTADNPARVARVFADDKLAFERERARVRPSVRPFVGQYT